MRITSYGHTMDYEAEQIVLLFFPDHENVFLSSTLTTSDGIVYVKTSAEVDGRKSSHTETAKDVNLSKRSLGNLVKRSAYFALRSLSGLPAPWGILTGVRPTKLIRILIDEGKSESEVRQILKEEYLVSDEKINLAIAVAQEESEYTQNVSEVCVYIGIPFCPTRCAYCSFISGTGAVATQEEYIRLLLLEIKRTGEIIKELDLSLRAIYIGGGTPTTLSPPLLEKLFDGINTYLPVYDGIEFTTEAGRPDTITDEKLKILKQYGTNRISINPQTLHDETLKRIGRRHTAGQFFEAFQSARENGFTNINTDLIAGLPGENLRMFCYTLDSVLALSPESLTLHTLYIKRASAIKQEGSPVYEEAETAEMLSYAYRTITEKGLRPYYMYRQKNTVGNLENVGYSVPGTASFYNTVTMTDCTHIFALGAGGVSRLLLPDKLVRVFNFKHDDGYTRDFETILKRKEEFYKIRCTKEK